MNLRMTDGTTLELVEDHGVWTLTRDGLAEGQWDHQPTQAELAEVTERLYPEGALRRAEDLLEERDAELREAGQDLMEARAEARMWQATADRLAEHLADVRETVALERARLERLETPPRWATGLDPATGTLPGVIHLETERKAKCGQIRTAPGLAHPLACLLPDDGHLAHSDGRYAWNAGTVQRLDGRPSDDPLAETLWGRDGMCLGCGHDAHPLEPCTHVDRRLGGVSPCTCGHPTPV